MLSFIKHIDFLPLSKNNKIRSKFTLNIKVISLCSKRNTLCTYLTTKRVANIFKKAKSNFVYIVYGQGVFYYDKKKDIHYLIADYNEYPLITPDKEQSCWCEGCSHIYTYRDFKVVSDFSEGFNKIECVYINFVNTKDFMKRCWPLVINIQRKLDYYSKYDFLQ